MLFYDFNISLSVGWKETVCCCGAYKPGTLWSQRAYSNKPQHRGLIKHYIYKYIYIIVFRRSFVFPLGALIIQRLNQLIQSNLTDTKFSVGYRLIYHTHYSEDQGQKPLNCRLNDIEIWQQFIRAKPDGNYGNVLAFNKKSLPSHVSSSQTAVIQRNPLSRAGTMEIYIHS